jgi:hypothetical protein
LTAEEHGVAPLVYVNLKNLSGQLAIPSDVLDRFKRSSVVSVVVRQQTDANLRQVLAVCAQRGIDVTISRGMCGPWT